MTLEGNQLSLCDTLTRGDMKSMFSVLFAWSHIQEVIGNMLIDQVVNSWNDRHQKLFSRPPRELHPNFTSERHVNLYAFSDGTETRRLSAPGLGALDLMISF